MDADIVDEVMRARFPRELMQWCVMGHPPAWWVPPPEFLDAPWFLREHIIRKEGERHEEIAVSIVNFMMWVSG